MRKSLLSAVSLLAAMSILMVSCGPAATTAAPATAAPAATAVPATSVPAATAAPAATAVPAATAAPAATDVPASAPVTIKIFSPQPADWDLATNAFSLSMEKMFNVKFEWTTSAYEPADAAEKKNLALASGDYPDTFVLVPWLDIFSKLDLLKYGSQGVILPLNDLIDQYAPHIKAALAANAGYRANATAPDGKIYGLPQLNECYHCSYPNKMWVNTKWLKALNIAPPKTTDEFKAMLIAFQKKDANGDGKPDEILAGANSDIGVHPVPFLMNAFIYDDDRTYLQVVNGKVDTVANKPGWKAGLTYIKSLYDAGVIDPGAFTDNLDAFSKLGANATAELAGAVATLHPWQFTNCAADAKPSYCQDYDPLPPLTGPDGTNFATYRAPSFSGGTFVLTNKASKEAQIAMIKIIDYMFTDDGRMASYFGVKGVDWRDPQPGELANNQSVKPLYYVIPATKPTNDYWQSSTQFWFTAAFRDAQVESDKIYTPDGYEHRLLLATDLYKGKESPSLFPAWNLWPDPAVSDEQALLTQNITDYITTNELAFITGAKSLDKDWDAYMKGLDDQNLAHYLDLNQKALDASKK